MTEDRSVLLSLNERLVNAELEASLGSKWFQTWFELIAEENGPAVPQQLADLAQRLDRVLAETMKQQSPVKEAAAPVQPNKRTFDDSETEVKEKVESSEQAVFEPEAKKTPVLAAEISQEIKIEEANPEAHQNQEVTPAEIKSVTNSPAPSKLAAFLSVAEPVTSVTAPTPSSPTKTAQTSKTSTSQTTVAKSPSSPSAAPKAPSSPSMVSGTSLSTKTPSSPSAANKTPSSPSAATKTPSSPSTATKAPSSPASQVKLNSSAVAKPPSTPNPPSFTSQSPPKSGETSTNSAPGSPGVASKQVNEAAVEGTKPAVKQTEGGHMEVPSECYDLFQEIKIRKKHRYLILKIQDWKLSVTKVGPRSATFEDFLKELPFSDCCYIVYDHERLKSDQYGSRVAEKVFFITWQPVPAPTQLKMLYSTERRTLSAVFKGVEDIVATKRDDVLVAVGAKGKFDAEDSDDEERGGKGDWMDD